MGGYLGKWGAPPPAAEGAADPPQRPATRQPSQALHQLHRVQHVHRAHPAPRLRPGRRPRDWDPANPASWAASEAWRRFPMRRPQRSIVGPLPADWWESYLKRTIWSLRHPRAVWSPVTVRITPRAQRGLPAGPRAQTIRSAGASALETPPDPRAKETVLQVLRESKPGRLRPEEPLPRAPVRPDSERGSPEATVSAFKPLGRSGNPAAFVPNLGPLSLGQGLNRRPSSCSLSSVASSRPAGPLGAKRNAITSSYSSAGGLSAPGKRRAPLPTPEWPVRKSGPQRRVPGPLASEEPRAASGSPGPRREETPQLLAGPAPPLALSPSPQLGYAVPAEDLASGTEGRLPWSSKTKKDVTDATADPAPDAQSAALPSLSRTLSPAGPDPAEGADPQVASPGPRASPEPVGERTSMVHSTPETPSLLAPLRCSGAEPHAGPSAGSESTAAVTFLTPVPPTSPVTDTTRPPSTCQADTSHTPPGPPAITPKAPSTERTAFGGVRRPVHHLSASAPPAATSADPTSKPSWRSPPNNEAGVSLSSSISPTTAARPPPGLSMPTFKPVFGGIEPLKKRPAIPPFSFEQTSPPGPPAAAHLFHSLGKISSIATSTTPVSKPTDSSLKPPRDFGGVGVTRTVGNTYSDTPPPHTFPLEASHAFRANFSSPVTGFTFPAPQLSTIPMVNVGNIFSQVFPSSVQLSPRKTAAHFKGKGIPLSPSALVTSSQPRLSSGISNPTSALTASLGSSSKPLFPQSLGVMPQPVFGASGGQRQAAHQPALSPCFKSSFVFGSSAVVSPTPASTPAQPAFGGPTQSAFGVLTPSASTFHVPASIQTGTGITPAGFLLGPASATSFGVVSQTHQSGVQTSVFGSTAPRPFAFGGLVTPMDCGEAGDSMTIPDMSSNSGVFSIGAMPGRATHTVTPFGKGWSQNTQGLTPQNTPFALGRPSISTRKIVFGGPPMAPFAHSLPVPRPVKTGSSFGSGISSPPVQGSLGRGSFRSAVPSFSIGAKPKTPKNRESGHSRRHHPHKK
ncbi:POM121-like protein 2 [Pipistrellus kuhlii]|uniref:POM121 transmembrane nucleoporin like 2 n=1 Tax=Pipistrellus kuhlii TaxID=59472 RepID=A0A7J7TWD6_PIPKU|nr:POM121-like protein 2 [Pipistrellus kuhlii]KAF6304912.1 POM121 transmembrane nucleoporin like 2 [Pipistrellus kuhlii]